MAQWCDQPGIHTTRDLWQHATCHIIHPDPADARKVALARALAVRSYLIDLGVKSRIEVGAFAADGSSGPSERVDVITP